MTVDVQVAGSEGVVSLCCGVWRCAPDTSREDGGGEQFQHVVRKWQFHLCVESQSTRWWLDGQRDDRAEAKTTTVSPASGDTPKHLTLMM